MGLLPSDLILGGFSGPGWRRKILLWEEHGEAAGVLVPALNRVSTLLWSVLTICPDAPALPNPGDQMPPPSNHSDILALL